MTKNSFTSGLTSPFAAITFLLGKIIRFVFFFFFLVILVDRTKFLAGFTKDQTIIFFLTYNIIDTTAQMFLREVYRFRPLVVTGNFDLILTKPINPLLRILGGGADPLDLFMLIPLIFVTGSYIQKISASPFQTIIYVMLVLNALLIATAFHILVAAVAILTTEIDHTIMIYRDLTSMGRFPVDIYQEPIKGFLTFVIPVGVMMTFPSYALMGLLSAQGIVFSFALGLGFLYLSLKIWRHSLRSYSSASS